MEDTLSRHANMLYVTASSRYETNLEDKFEKTTKVDKYCLNLKEKTTRNEVNHVKREFNLNKKGLLLHKRKLYIPNLEEAKLIVMNELHKRLYSGHPEYQKMITMIRKYFFWPNMKNEMAEYLARCIECHQVSVEHRHLAKLLQPLPI